MTYAATLRKTIFGAAACFILLPSLLVAQNPGDNIFNGIQVHSIKIQMNQTNYWDSLVFYYNQNFEQYMAATITLNDTIILDSVGVRLKGNSSFTHPNNKKSIRLSFDEYKTAQRWDGEKSIHLNNCWGDPSFMREKMHLDFLRDAGIAGPRGNYIFVTINGQAWGLYSLIEHVDKTFLENHYSDKSGNLYKAVDGFGASAAYFSDFKWYGSSVDTYKVRYELKTDESLTPWSDIVSVIDTLSKSTAISQSFPKMVNIKTFTRAMAADNLFANLDSYLNSARNFYVYFFPLTGKLEWIVWDTGLSFGAYAPGISNLDQLNIAYVSNSTNRPLMGKILNNPQLKNEYLKSYYTLFTQYFSVARLTAHADSIANAIRSYVSADPKKMYTAQQFESNIVGTITAAGGAGITKPGIKSFITARASNVQTQLAAVTIDWKETIQPGDVVINEFMAQNDSILDPSNEAEDWIELYNNTSEQIDLERKLLSDNFAAPAKWSFPAGTVIPAKGYLVVWADEDSGQSGLHAQFKLSAGGEKIVLSNADSSVIDSVTFGVQVLNISSSRLPNGTGNFYPAVPSIKAANIGTVPVIRGEIVINEFAADNDSIVDPAGEAENWIELYNTTAREINLAGMFLSDNYLLPAKWTFPINTTIPAKGYLIVWADEDSGQAGIHAMFKLLKSGEKIMLCSTDTTVIDSVTFGGQTTNLTMARKPNGTGNFMQGIPTFNTNNDPAALNPGDVTINEFLASNSIITDPSGEYEDWIELYNNTDAQIDLSGCFLTDNFTSPAKWTVPANVKISAKGYLIVWCDEDTGQAGLHAMIKLSTDGERIMLSNANMTMLDSITFGAQTINMSMARIPNGTGPFKQVIPTFGTENQDKTVSVSTTSNSMPTEFGLSQNYPNPFNPATVIEYQLPQSTAVTLAVYDLIGKQIAVIAQGVQSAGYHAARFDASTLSSGIYFYRLSAGSFIQTKRMIILK